MDIKQNIHKGSKVGHFEAYMYEMEIYYMGYSYANQTYKLNQ